MSAILHGACVLTLVYVAYRASDLPVLFVDLTMDLPSGPPALPAAAGRETAARGRLRSPQSPTQSSDPRGGAATPGPTREPSSRDEPSSPPSAPRSARPALAASDDGSQVGGTQTMPSGLMADERTRSDAQPSSGGGTPESTGRGASENPPAAVHGAPGGRGGGAAGEMGGRDGASSPHQVAGHGGGGSALAARGGGAGGAAAEYGPYLTLWRTRIHESLRYPLAARRRNLTGTVQIEIVIEPSGAVGGVKVVESSSHDILDEAALESVKRLSPLPFPPHLVPRSIRARLPVVFEIR